MTRTNATNPYDACGDHPPVHNASPSDSLRDVLALLTKATPGPWTQGEGDPEHVLTRRGWRCIAETNDATGGVADAAAIVAAVNYLRVHGESIARRLAGEGDAQARARLCPHGVRRMNTPHTDTTALPSLDDDLNYLANGDFGQKGSRGFRQEAVERLRAALARPAPPAVDEAAIARAAKALAGNREWMLVPDPEKARLVDMARLVANALHPHGQEAATPAREVEVPSPCGDWHEPAIATLAREDGNADRMAIRLLVAGGFVIEEKANEALRIAHGFDEGPLNPPKPAGAEAVARYRIKLVRDDAAFGYTLERDPDGPLCKYTQVAQTLLARNLTTPAPAQASDTGRGEYGIRAWILRTNHGTSVHIGPMPPRDALVEAWTSTERLTFAVASPMQGWTAEREEKAWCVRSPSGDGCEVVDSDQSPRAEVLRQLAQSLATPTPASEDRAGKDGANG